MQRGKITLKNVHTYFDENRLVSVWAVRLLSVSVYLNGNALIYKEKKWNCSLYTTSYHTFKNSCMFRLHIRNHHQAENRTLN